MKGISDFIAMASAQLGEPESKTREATGALLGALKNKADTGDFQQLLGAIPGASDLVPSTDSAPSSGLSGAMGAVTSKLGGLGAAGGAMGLVAMIAKTGFSPGKIGGLVTKFMELVKSSAGEGLATKLMANLPDLAAQGA